MKAATRLRRSADFARVRQEGDWYRHSALLMAVCANGLTGNRYGFVVGRHIGNAVQRNRVKRRLRALIDALDQNLRQGYDVALIARRPINWQPYSELRRIVVRLFSRSGLMIC